MIHHPSSEVLALFASADLPWIDRLKVARHVSGCESCDRELALARASMVELKHQARTETLTGFEAVADWSRLEREMEGNIIVGLAAARCIGKDPRTPGILRKLGYASALGVLFMLAWVTHVPPVQSSRIVGVIRSAFAGYHRQSEYHGPILRTQPGGIMVGSQDGSLTIFHPASAVVSMSGTSSVEARYIDDETGQVTITDVYGP